MKHRTLLLAVLSLALASALAFAGPAGSAGGKGKKTKPGDPTALQGQKAPSFELSTLDGKTVKLDDLKGEVVVLDFWATWCGPCRESLPHIQSMAKNTDLTSKGLKVYAVNLREGEDKVKPFMEKNKFNFNVAFDSDGAVAQSYLVSGIPQTVVIGRDGLVKNVFVGFGGEESSKQLDAAVEAALKMKASSARGPSTQPSSQG